MIHALARPRCGPAVLVPLFFLASIPTSPAHAAGDVRFAGRLALADGTPAAGYRLAVVGRPLT